MKMWKLCTQGFHLRISNSLVDSTKVTCFEFLQIPRTVYSYLCAHGRVYTHNSFSISIIPQTHAHTEKVEHFWVADKCINNVKSLFVELVCVNFTAISAWWHLVDWLSAGWPLVSDVCCQSTWLEIQWFLRLWALVTCDCCKPVCHSLL